VHHEPELCPSRLSVDVEREDARVSLALRGELVLESAPQFREHLDDVEEDAMTLVVDLRNLTFLDSCGIGELVGAHQRARRDGRRLVVVRYEGTPIHRVLRVAELDETLETSADPPGLGVPKSPSDKFERGLLEGRASAIPTAEEKDQRALDDPAIRTRRLPDRRAGSWRRDGLRSAVE
jgi:anti-anti-sigma factor